MMLVAIVSLVLTSCGDEPELLKTVDVNGENQPTVEATLANVWGDACELVKSNAEVANTENGNVAIEKSYDFEKTFELVYSDGSNKEEVEEYSLTHKVSFQMPVLTINDINDIAGQRFVAENNEAQIANQAVRVSASRNDHQKNFSNGSKTWIFDTRSEDEGWNDEQTRYVGSLCNNSIIEMSFAFSGAEKVEGTDNTYNLTCTFTAKVNEGEDMKYSFPVVATTAEKDEIYYLIEVVGFKGNNVLFNGITGHTLHPEQNTTEALTKEFDCSLRAGEMIRYNSLNAVELNGQNANEFRYNVANVVLTATYPSEVAIEFNGVQQMVTVPTPSFNEINRNSSSSETDDFNYINTEIQYGMSWGDVVAATATQAFQGWVEKEKDVVTGIDNVYTEINGEINGQLIERHSLEGDKVLLTYHANREFSVKAEDMIVREVSENTFALMNRNNGSWSNNGAYVGDNVKGSKMSATFVYTYSHEINNNVTIYMNRGLYVEYNGKRYEIADVNATLSASAPAMNNTVVENQYTNTFWSVLYTAKASDMQATATQEFKLQVKNPESIFTGWEIDENYSAMFAVTNSYSMDKNTVITVATLVWRKIDEPSLKKVASFEINNNVLSSTALVEQDMDEATLNAALSKGKLFSVIFAKDNNRAAAMLEANSFEGSEYLNGFAYSSMTGNLLQGFDPTIISVRKLANPFKGYITKNVNGTWGTWNLF